MKIKAELIEKYLDQAKIKAVENYDFANKKINYSGKIKSWRKIDSLTGDEEIIRVYIFSLNLSMN